MDYIRFLGDSFDYTKEALWGRWVRWLLLLISVVIFPFIYGYGVRVMNGAKPAPELEGWVGLFIDGIKLIIITVVYAIPIWIFAFLPFAAYFIPTSATVTPATGPEPLFDPGMGIVVALGFIALFLVVAIVVGILATFAMVRFSRTGRMREAFRIRALLAHIGKIGWLNCFIALVVLTVAVAIVEFILVLVPIIGAIILLLLMPAFIIFTYRYIALLYESAPAPA
ncbi:DUF4013 domain-containing protein [Methanoculleus sp. 7T]|mgnify:CR=1 FL=1|uniref:DUF4013 domain-containing protein n=1 Tax=Methanoculleus sp. 7T TaxID=2937282 RepID=UPI0020BEA5DA|nr:DUF4013 domain-containing protein [Methanoculleus sp. 7T]MCK8519832.1 DUF4013 domain-containing protein [Methanoculleus sp. 7T]